MNSNMEKPYVVGIDIGGTNTVFGIVDARGTIIASSSIKTGAYEDVNVAAPPGRMPFSVGRAAAHYCQRWRRQDKRYRYRCS